MNGWTRRRAAHLAAGCGVIAAGLAGTGCVRGAGSTAVQPPAFTASASIQDLMKAQIEPSAQFIWESVSSTTTAAGTVDQRPQTDAQWLELRYRALTLTEAANLLLVPGRSVVAHGGALEDAHVQGIFTAQEIERAISEQPEGFATHVQRLHDTASAVLAAVDARDVARLVEAGGYLDEACEACHLRFWYPNAPLPAELRDAAATGQ